MSSWSDLVGKRFRAWDGRTYTCFAYDPRAGLWMRAVDDGPDRETCVSERAIDRTFHQIRTRET